MKNKKILLSAGIFISIITSVFFLSGCLKEKNTINYKMDLEVWGFIDDSEAFQEINKNYREVAPQIQRINYKKVSSNIDEFEEELVDAIASGKGPDVIFFHNSWLLEHADKIASDPQSSRDLNAFNMKFIDVASTDFIKDNEIYAMPLYSDTLALFYNKDIFNQEALTKTPETWEELAQVTKKITRIDQNGNFSRSAIALGRSNNPGGINRSSDIISLLFMQNGINMVNETGTRCEFDKSEKSAAALDFYTKFAKNSDFYTWNSKMDYSVDSFRFGKTAMMLNYSYVANRLKETDPKFNFGIAPVPQMDLDNKINFANYWGLAVVKNKVLVPETPTQIINYTNEDRIRESWNYIKYVTMGTITNSEGQEVPTSFDATKNYLEKTHKPAARKDLIEEQKSDPELGIFAVQALTAKSWKGPKVSDTEVILNEMINSVVSGSSAPREAINTAASRINVLLTDLLGK